MRKKSNKDRYGDTLPPNLMDIPFSFGENFKMGRYCIINDDVVIGDNVSIGDYCKIGAGCRIGDNVKIQSSVEFRNNTIIGNNCYIDSGVKTSGNCVIGNYVTIRYDSIIARDVTIEDHCFIAPQVMTIYSTHQGEKLPGTVIGKGAYIGTNVTLGPAVKICPHAIIGVKADKSCEDLSGKLKNYLKFGGKLKMTIAVGDIEDVVIAHGSPALKFIDEKNTSIQKTDFIDERTLAVLADKSASDLNEELVKKLKSSNTKVKIVLEIE